MTKIISYNNFIYILLINLNAIYKNFYNTNICLYKKNVSQHIKKLNEAEQYRNIYQCKIIIQNFNVQNIKYQIFNSNLCEIFSVSFILSQEARNIKLLICNATIQHFHSKFILQANMHAANQGETTILAILLIGVNNST